MSSLGHSNKHRTMAKFSLHNITMIVHCCCLWCHCWTTLCPTVVVAFATGGGGGGGGFGNNNSSSRSPGSTDKSNKKVKQQDRVIQRKKSGLAEVTTTTATTILPTEENIVFEGDKTKPSTPKLDRWGLPPPTLEDIFPLLPKETELISVDPTKEYTLDDIQQCLMNHIDLDLPRYFNENCVGKLNNTDGSNMIVRLLHQSPPVLAIENFMTPKECQDIQSATTIPTSHQVHSATFQGSISTRTSTSWFCHYANVPLLLAKAHYCLNIPLETMEEPQVVRYERGQEFSWHYDEVPTSQLENGGQRLATILVYLNTVPSTNGGGTTFRDLKQHHPSMIDHQQQEEQQPLVMQPQQGSALIFFPAFANGQPDDRTLHKSEIMDWDEAKWIVQMWVHERDYQAVLPRGNSKVIARPLMEDMGRKLGYPTHR
jgi:prolyl 4-hydroxylase